MLNITVRRSSDHSRMRYQEGATGKRDDECLGKSIHMHAVICGISACHLSVSELVSETVRGQALWACRCCCAPAVVSRVITLYIYMRSELKIIAASWAPINFWVAQDGIPSVKVAAKPPTEIEHPLPKMVTPVSAPRHDTGAGAARERAHAHAGLEGARWLRWGSTREQPKWSQHCGLSSARCHPIWV